MERDERQFKQLADGYGAPWPIESTETRAMRLSDKELGTHLSALEQNSKQAKKEFDKAMSKDKTAPKGARDEVKRSFDTFTKQVKDLRDAREERTSRSASGGDGARLGDARSASGVRV